MKDLLFFIVLLISLCSCNSTFQYDVLVKNETGEDIKISYKTENDVRGSVEESVSIANGELKRIISTSEIEGSGNSTSAAHCKQVAEYVDAYKGEVKSKKLWCSEGVDFKVVDIGQGEFVLTYTANDF